MQLLDRTYLKLMVNQTFVRLYFVRFDFFLAAIIGLLTIYYSVAYFLIFALWKKPLQSLKESFLESQKTAQEPEIIEEEISEE